MSSDQSSPTPGRMPERGFTRSQIREAEEASNGIFAGVMRAVRQRSHATYDVAEPAVLRNCLASHLDAAARQDMITAEVYTCPTCGSLLKDRRTRVAAAIMLERRRIRDLWLQVEDHTGQPDFHEYLGRFRVAIDLGAQSGREGVRDE